jgi:hypothetical protein
MQCSSPNLLQNALLSTKKLLTFAFSALSWGYQRFLFHTNPLKQLNIFALHSDPKIAATFYADKHCIKQILEFSQILTASVIRHGAAENQLPLTKSGTPVKKTHEKHPSTLWAGNTRSNFDWLCEHAKELCREYTFRYGKIHFCEKGIHQLSSLNYLIPEGELQPFAIAINKDMTCRQLPGFESMSPVDKYLLYYIHDKKRIAKWEKGRCAPDWFSDPIYR